MKECYMNVNTSGIVSTTVLTLRQKMTLIFDDMVQNRRRSRLERAKIVKTVPFSTQLFSMIKSIN